MEWREYGKMPAEHSWQSYLQMHNQCLAKDNMLLFYSFTHSHNLWLRLTTYNHALKANRLRPAPDLALLNLVFKLYVLLCVKQYALYVPTIPSLVSLTLHLFEWDCKDMHNASFVLILWASLYCTSGKHKRQKKENKLVELSPSLEF